MIYKRLSLQKLGLSKNFSHYALYSRRSVLGVGTIKLTMIVAMATLKQFFGSMRLRNNVSEMMKVILEFAIVRYGYKTNVKSNYYLQYWKSS